MRDNLIKSRRLDGITIIPFGRKSQGRLTGRSGVRVQTISHVKPPTQPRLLPGLRGPKLVIKHQSALYTQVNTSLNLKFSYRLKIAACVLILSATLVSGIWIGIKTPSIAAESNQAPAAQDSPLIKPPIPLMVVAGGNTQETNITNQVLFSLPLNELENVFARNQQARQQKLFAEQLAIRAQKIKNYLEGKKSPFANVAGVIAEQAHWKLILAIAFAESSWGRNCTDKNCSNIGVKSGHELWHRYASYSDWVIDFNKLLERRYKDSSLESMCGVYVKPCNTNWLLATRSVLEELSAQGIE